MQVFKQWMSLATSAEIDELAASAGTSRAYLYALASEGKSYSREADNGLAGRIERAAEGITRRAGGRLPKVLRTDLNAECRVCSYAEKCLGADAIKSHFRVLDDEAKG